jgi:hypothetical protein
MRKCIRADVPERKAPFVAVRSRRQALNLLAYCTALRSEA